MVFFTQINFLHRNEMFDAVDNKLSKVPPSTSVHFATLMWQSRDVGLSSAVRCLCRQQHPKCGRAILLVRPPYFRKLRSSSNPREKKSKGVWSGDVGGWWIGPRRPVHGPGKVELRYCTNGRVQGLQYRGPRIPNTRMPVNSFRFSNTALLIQYRVSVVHADGQTWLT